MANLNQYYRIFDPDPTRGAIRIEREEATYWNQKDWGIFWTINDFGDKPRRISNLVRINAWFLDLDSGDKSNMLAKIKSGLVPSLVTETKKGYHVYFLARDATVTGYRSILLDRLVPFYNADPKATDLARIARAPGFYHCKDPANKFLVQFIHKHEVRFTEQELCWFYKPSRDALMRESARKEFQAQLAKANESKIGESKDMDLWDKIWVLNCEYALLKLSGHQAVGCETYSFRRVSSGNLNILVNNKSTSCWIDKEGRIGSLDRGGPTIYNWVNWYQRSPWKTIQYLREVFPELWTQESINQN